MAFWSTLFIISKIRGLHNLDMQFMVLEGIGKEMTDNEKWRETDSSRSFCLVFPGIVTESTDGTIIIENVPVVTPNCDVVVPSLNLTVKPQMHVLISGRMSTFICVFVSVWVCMCVGLCLPVCMIVRVWVYVKLNYFTRIVINLFYNILYVISKTIFSINTTFKTLLLARISQMLFFSDSCLIFSSLAKCSSISLVFPLIVGSMTGDH